MSTRQSIDNGNATVIAIDCKEAIVKKLKEHNYGLTDHCVTTITDVIYSIIVANAFENPLTEQCGPDQIRRIG